MLKASFQSRCTFALIANRAQKLKIIHLVVCFSIVLYEIECDVKFKLNEAKLHLFTEYRLWQNWIDPHDNGTQAFKHDHLSVSNDVAVTNELNETKTKIPIRIVNWNTTTHEKICTKWNSSFETSVQFSIRTPWCLLFNCRSTSFPISLELVHKFFIENDNFVKQ